MNDANASMCPLCGSATEENCTSTDYISGEQFSIDVCTSCALGITRPRVPAGDLSRYYAQGYYKKRKSGADNHINRTRLRKVSRILTTGKRILDVGCGNGALIELFEKSGWDARGLELAPPEHFVNDEVQKKIFIGDVRNAPFAEKSFDVITLFHVLEHMTEPEESLAKISTLLAHDGLLIIEVPNRASWQARLTRGKWFNFDVPRHVFHFTPRSLTMMLEKTGFHVENILHYSPIYSYYSWIQSLLNLVSVRNNTLFDLLNGKRTMNASWDALATFVLVIPAAVIAVPLTFVESIFKRGGIITLYARPH